MSPSKPTLTPSQVKVLNGIDSWNEENPTRGATLDELCHHIGLTKNSSYMQRRLRKLKDQGLIDSIPRQYRSRFITFKGRQALKKHGQESEAT